MKYKVDKVKGYYDDYGNSYDKERNGTYYYSFINEIEVAEIYDFCCEKITLEIGCGSGIILQEIDKIAKNAVGMDLSVGMLQSCLRKGLTVSEGDATKIPFADASFDLVYSFKVLPHIEDLDSVFSEINRVLRPGGRAVLEFYNPLSFKGLSNLIMRSGSKVYLKFHHPKELRQKLGDTFKVEREFGARIVTPFALLHRVPLLSHFLKFLEKSLSATFLKRFAGYYSFVVVKPDA